jgi:predicted phage tail protein
MRDNLSKKLGQALPEDLFIEDKDFGLFKAIVTGCIIAISFFVTLIILNFVVSGLLWAVISRGL